jgi:hypothetical protein
MEKKRHSPNILKPSPKPKITSAEDDYLDEQFEEPEDNSVPKKAPVRYKQTVTPKQTIEPPEEVR